MRDAHRPSCQILLAGIVLATAAVMTLVACSQPAASKGDPSTSSATGYTTIQPSEAKEMIDSDTVTVVDVRTQSEYEDAHLENAVLVSLDTIGDTDITALPDKDATLIVYCRTGVRSAQACAALAKLGYTHVYNMDGGITSWTYGTVAGTAS
jgi:rhodanese-related sulfurtransferase